MRRTGQECHWILEVHLVDRARRMWKYVCDRCETTFARKQPPSKPVKAPALNQPHGVLDLTSASRRYQHELQEQAEACFREAMITARRQGAKSLELRAVTSFSRLCREGRKKKQAFRMLSKIYGSFNEGFETTDLVEARALLSELG